MRRPGQEWNRGLVRVPATAVKAQVHTVHGGRHGPGERPRIGRAPRGSASAAVLYGSLTARDLDLLLLCFGTGLRDRCLDLKDTVLVCGSDVPLLDTLG